MGLGTYGWIIDDFLTVISTLGEPGAQRLDDPSFFNINY